MFKSIVVIFLSFILCSHALADDMKVGQGQVGVGDRKQNHQDREKMRMERRKKILDQKCHGDQSCEAQMKQKFEEKRAKMKAAIEQQCGQNADQQCRQRVRKEMIQQFKQNHQAGKKHEE